MNIKCIINTTISEQETQEGDMIVLPGQQGELGILYNHMNMIAELAQGKIRVYLNNKIVQELEITGGIAYIKKDIIEIFCL